MKSISLPLSILCNTSLVPRCFPAKRKKLTSYQKDDRTILNNYRSISPLTCVSEIIELIVLNICIIVCMNASWSINTDQDFDLDTRLFISYLDFWLYMYMYAHITFEKFSIASGTTVYYKYSYFMVLKMIFSIGFKVSMWVTACYVHPHPGCFAGISVCIFS